MSTSVTLIAGHFSVPDQAHAKAVRDELWYRDAPQEAIERVVPGAAGEYDVFEAVCSVWTGDVGYSWDEAAAIFLRAFGCGSWMTIRNEDEFYALHFEKGRDGIVRTIGSELGEGLDTYMHLDGSHLADRGIAQRAYELFCLDYALRSGQGIDELTWLLASGMCFAQDAGRPCVQTRKIPRLEEFIATEYADRAYMTRLLRYAGRQDLLDEYERDMG